MSPAATCETTSDAPALSRGLALLRLIATEGPLSFADLLRRSGIPRASLIRLLAVLRTEGYLQRSADGHGPGPGLTELQPVEDPLTRLRGRLPQILPRLRDETGNTAACFHWDGEQMGCLASAVHANALPMQPPGRQTPNYQDNPWGWILAEQHGLPIEAPHRRKGALQQALRSYRRSGVMVDRLINPRFWIRLAVPVRSETFLALGGNPLTLPDEALAACQATLLAAAAELAEPITRS